ncbi:hypothetical protein LOTGIDRAFT_155356 [Lottia gigantea]|uniref:Uncharacterized protein n=1 Tax=Lottia gigantea TaxID=225164 RepID=V3ZIJ5_LOTGI|nr:hypothetical protein LOTGIDRAFT_155356 [Lottia gigantea]ESO84042.1 hypothetical protein LOTGIDRAFT_155356 [Lottia gigantea]
MPDQNDHCWLFTQTQLPAAPIDSGKRKELYFYPGGCAIVSSVGETETRMSIQNNFKLLNDILEKCVSDNIITKTEKENTTYAACFRRQDEIKEPFVNSNVLTDLGLHLHQVKQELVPCFYTAEWKQRLDTGVDDRDKFAHDFTSNVRTFTYSSIYRALHSNRSEQEKSIICDKFYKKYENALRNSYPPDLDSLNILQVAYVKKK